jgi:hypothetical protein
MPGKSSASAFIAGKWLDAAAGASRDFPSHRILLPRSKDFSLSCI